ncbi:multifunctional protein ADE2-like protein [Cricetulus griseus]|uniref:Multifunctional protein ADE2-like protein n=1 Tax=Cricetulus griseus TaxID=10029 RepID=A0A061INY3_CRIGR|nr:multifunctional protein ADE2-like protein [Cricetulus griseus]
MFRLLALAILNALERKTDLYLVSQSNSVLLDVASLASLFGLEIISGGLGELTPVMLEGQLTYAPVNRVSSAVLPRNPGVKEWYKFYPPKVEVFFKDNAKNDTQWSEEQLIAAKFCFAGLVIGQTEVDIMSHAIQPIFEILEKSWFPQNCMLIDAKIEFAGGVTTKEIVFTNVIDDDSWRLWPSGDRSQQKDSLTVTSRKLTLEGLQMWSWMFNYTFSRRISPVCCSDIWVKQPFRVDQTLSEHFEHVGIFKVATCLDFEDVKA